MVLLLVGSGSRGARRATSAASQQLMQQLEAAAGEGALGPAVDAAGAGEVVVRHLALHLLDCAEALLQVLEFSSSFLTFLG